MGKFSENKGYEELINNIGSLYDRARKKVVSAVNVEMLSVYWEIGRFIVEFEQKGNIKAKYGKELLLQMSKDLSLKFGKGFSRSN